MALMLIACSSGNIQKPCEIGINCIEPNLVQRQVRITCPNGELTAKFLGIWPPSYGELKFKASSIEGGKCFLYGYTSDQGALFKSIQDLGNYCKCSPQIVDLKEGTLKNRKNVSIID